MDSFAKDFVQLCLPRGKKSNPGEPRDDLVGLDPSLGGTVIVTRIALGQVRSTGQGPSGTWSWARGWRCMGWGSQKKMG